MNKKTAHSSHSQLASKTITCNIHRCKFSPQAKNVHGQKVVDWINASDTIDFKYDKQKGWNKWEEWHFSQIL